MHRLDTTGTHAPESVGVSRVSTRSTGARCDSAAMSDPLWFKDAVIYQLHVKTFQDSDGDGVGDFIGLTQRLDYLVELGVTALWVMPFYPSPLRDDGYDIADYLAVHPSYGTLADFEAFMAAAHARGLRVITELVLNHTSDQHAWFQRARRAPAGSPERDYYVWSETPDRYREVRLIFPDFEPSNWTWDPTANAYYWHRFFAHQPDLNFDHPPVKEELLRAVDFWMERGVDGLRLDAVAYLYEREGTNGENLPETHAFIRKLRAHIDGKFPDRMLLAEANQWPEDAAEYYGTGDECHMNFHFPLMPRLFMALQMEDRFPIIDILEQTPPIPDGCQWAIFLRNHDELTLEMVTDEERDYMVRVYAADPRARINVGIRRRLAPLVGNNRRKIELLNSLLLSMPGTPILYYGDELGMGDNIFLGDRNGVRTPMQWSPDRNAGFSSANPQRLLLPLIIDPEYHYETVNAENQKRNASSLFWWMRRILAVRRGSAAFARGSIEFLQPENAKVLAYLRRLEGETILVVANLSRFVQVVELDLSAFAGIAPEELFGRTRFPALRADVPMVVTLGPHGFYWLALQSTAATDRAVVPELPAFAGWSARFVATLTSQVLPCFLRRCAWFRPGGRTVRDYAVGRTIELTDSAWLCLIEVHFTEGEPDTYALPLARVAGEAAARLQTEHPKAVLAQLGADEVLADALYLPAMREHLLQLHRPPDARTFTARSFSEWPVEPSAISASQLLDEDCANTNIAFGDALLLKVYRRIEPGSHPEVTVLEALQRRGFATVPPLFSALSLPSREGSTVLSAVTGYVAHQGDGWTFTLDALARFFDRAQEARLDAATADAATVIGAVYPERVRLLAAQVAELHLALADETGPAFVPEPFSVHYQRSLYQAMRGQAGRVLRLLRQRLGSLSEDDHGLAGQIVENRRGMLAIFARLHQQRFAGARMRVHGDLHLGQLLNTGKAFVVIDFEGDASRPLGERSLKRSPLVDVAALLRSFDFAAEAAVHREMETDRAALRLWASVWVAHVTEVFVRAYFEALGEAAIVPRDAAERAALLELFLVDRALREVAHELARPSEFISVPLRALATHLKG